MILTGTASGHNNLLDQLRDFLVNDVGWTEMEYSGVVSPGNNLEQVRLRLRGPGATTGNEFFLNILTQADTVNGAYGWRMRMAQNYEAGVSDESQEGASPVTYFNLWENTIDFWFYASGRRVIVVAKCNISYMSMYAGCFLPFALPTEYLRPFYISANFDSLQPCDLSNSRNSFIANPGTLTTYFLDIDGSTWVQVQNASLSASNFIPTEDSNAVIWPHRSMNAHMSIQNDWNFVGMFLIRPNANGEQPAFICHILSPVLQRAVGTLDGVYATGGFGRVSEQEMTLGGSPFRLFQNVFRSTPRDFMAIEET